MLDLVGWDWTKVHQKSWSWSIAARIAFGLHQQKSLLVRGFVTEFGTSECTCMEQGRLNAFLAH